jgi:hypothetical protein
VWEDISWRRLIVNSSLDNFNKIFIKNSRPHACQGFVPFPADLLTRDEGGTQVNSPVYNTADAWLPTRACPIKVIRFAAENMGTLHICLSPSNPPIIYVLGGNVLMLMQAWGCHRTGHHSPPRGESHLSVQNSPICGVFFCVLPSAWCARIAPYRQKMLSLFYDDPTQIPHPGRAQTLLRRH